LEKYPTSLYYNKARKIITEIKSTENKKIWVIQKITKQ
jgi:hypothetical protein